MIVRHWLGDFALAILLALPLAVLARPQTVPNQNVSTAVGMKIAGSDSLAGTGRISLLR